MKATRFKPPTTHRTNSLGWAKSDCHSCQSSSRTCDRRRPRCNSCTSQGVICGGYVQRLQWQNQGHEVDIQWADITDFGTADQRETTKSITYSFAHEDGKYRTKHQKSRWASNEVVEAPSSLPDADPGTKTGSHDTVRDIGPMFRQPDYLQIPSSTLEQLAFFMWTFSPVTLTYEVKANPWQECLSQTDSAPFLLDAVRALAIRHRSHLEEKPEGLSVMELKDSTLSIYGQTISTMSLEVGVSVSLILIGIDYAESALGNWTIHLRGVYGMIEAAGGIQLADQAVHIKAQIAQLVWYDTIISLLSRKTPLYPRKYAERVILWENEAQWSLLALNGFPDSAFLNMYDIAEAASHASDLSDGYVTGLEMKLWLARFDTEQGENDKEISALTDCWRLGLLLYCTRVSIRVTESRKRLACLQKRSCGLSMNCLQILTNRSRLFYLCSWQPVSSTPFVFVA